MAVGETKADKARATNLRIMLDTMKAVKEPITELEVEIRAYSCIQEGLASAEDTQDGRIKRARFLDIVGAYHDVVDHLGSLS